MSRRPYPSTRDVICNPCDWRLSCETEDAQTPARPYTFFRAALDRSATPISKATLTYRYFEPMSNTILDRVKKDLTQAMKDQDDVRRRALRSLRAALANKEIEQREEGAETTLSEQEELAVVQKQVKQRRDSIEQYEEAGRDDLAQKEREEIEVLEKYLPDRMSDEELAERLDAIIDEVGATSMADMGPVMGRAMDELRGRVDGNRVRERVQDALSD